VLALSVAAAIDQSRHLARSSPFGWDEAEHAWHGLEVATDLARLDGRGLARDLLRQGFWPPFQSVYLAPYLLAFGPSTEAARAASLPLLVVAALGVAWIAAALATRRPVLSAMAAAAFLLTSRNALLYSRTTYQESLLLALHVGMSALWIRGARHGEVVSFLSAGACAAASFLTKYPFGMLATAAGAVGAVALALAGARREASRSLLFLAPPVLVGAAWFLFPLPDGVEPPLKGLRRFFAHNLSVQDFHPTTYYFDSIQKSYAISLPAALFAGGSLVALAVSAIVRIVRRAVAGTGDPDSPWRSASTLVLAAELVGFLLVGGAAGAKQERTLLPWTHPLFVAGGIGTAFVAGAIGRRLDRAETSRAGSLATISVALLLGGTFALVPCRFGGTIPGPSRDGEPVPPARGLSFVSPVANLRFVFGDRGAVPAACYREATPLLQFVAETAPREARFLWLGGFDEFSPFLLRWEIARRLRDGSERARFVASDPVAIVESDPYPGVGEISPGSLEERAFFEETARYTSVFVLDPPDPKARAVRAHLAKLVRAFPRHPGFREAGSASAVLPPRPGLDVPVSLTRWEAVGEGPAAGRP
jgi:hypothetical protein